MQVVIELPYIFVQSVIYGVIVYSMIGFEWTTDKFFWYLFFMYFTLLYFTFYGMMTVAVTPNQSIAAIVASAFYAIWNLFSGFIIPKTVSSNNFNSSSPFKKTTHKGSYLSFSYHNRGFQCGGSGTSTFARSLGLCMDY